MPTTLIIYSAEEVAKVFRALGIWVGEVTERNELCDGTVELPNKFRIQVGQGYLILVKTMSDGKITFGKTRNHPREVVSDYLHFEK
jgi:hypothetical protein